MSKHIFMAYDSGGVKMSDYMLNATKDSLVFDFSRNSIYIQNNEFGYTGVVCYEVPASELSAENRKLITNIYKMHTGEIGVTYTSLGSTSGESVVGGIELPDVAVTGPTTYADVISNITQDGLGQIGYTYTRIYTGHTTYDGTVNNNGTYSINGVYLSTNGELNFSYRDLTVTDGTPTTSVVLGGDNPANIKVVTAISESADGKITYSYTDISTKHTNLGEWKFNNDYYDRLITNVHLDNNGNFTYSYEQLKVENNSPKYSNSTTEDISSDNTVNVININNTQANSKANAMKVVTGVSLLKNNLTVGLEYSYSYIYSNSSHHNTLNGVKGNDIKITSTGVPLINGTYLSADGTLSYSYSNYIVENSTYAEILSYLTVNEIAHSEQLYSLVDIYKDTETGRLIALKTSLENTTAGDLTEIPINSVSYFEVIDNITQSKDGKITYTSKKIVNAHSNTGSTARTNHIINNVSINSYGNLSYTYYDASVNTGYFTNQVQNYNSHNTGISGDDIPQTELPNTKENSISVINGLTQGADGQITYSYISVWGNPEAFTKHIFNLTKTREYTADEAQGNTVPVVYLLDNNENNGTSVDRTYLNYSTIEVPTKNYLDNLMQANDALRYCGTVDASSDANGNITLHYHPSSNTSGFDENNPDLLKGAVYKITNIGYIGTQRVSPGDMIISYTDTPSPTLVNPISGWDIINENIDIRQNKSVAENTEDGALVVTNVHISADGELTYTYSPVSIRTVDRTNPSIGESLRTLSSGVASYDISTASSSKMGIPVITYVGTTYTGLTHQLEFKVSYIYSSQNHHSYEGLQNTSGGTRVITNVNLSNDGKLSYTYNIETAYTYNGSLDYNPPTANSLNSVDILHQDAEVNANTGYNVITGVKIERHENEVSLSYTYTSIYASQNHHTTIYPETYTDIVLSAEGTKVLSGASLTETGTFTYSVSNIIVADAGTLSSIVGVQIPSYTYSVVNIYKDMNNHGVITYSFVDLAMNEEDGIELEPITVKEDTSINVITYISQRGDGKVTYSYTPINIASLWERGSGDISVQTVNSGSEAIASYSVAGGYFVVAANEIGESAFGIYNNRSNSHLIHSIGIGYFDNSTNSAYRMNAIEVLSNGDFYLYGVGKFDGTNSTDNNTKSVQQYIEDKEFVISEALNDLNQRELDLQNQIDSLPIVWEPGENTYSVQQIGTEAFAYGNYSVAESGGFSYGNSSHAEGSQTISGGEVSHAEGVLTYTKGNYSHAEGYRTYTYNVAEHAEGSNNFSHQGSTVWGSAFNTLSSVGMGQPDHYDEYRKNALEIMQNGDMYVYGLGYYDGKDPTTALPLQKYIETVGVWEKGQGTYAVQVRNTQSYALGAYSLASGRFSYAYGQYAIAEGYQSYALGSYATSIGRNSYAIGENSFATGYHTYSIGKTSSSSGYFTYAYGEASHTEGKLTYTLASYSHAEGAYTYATANQAHAEGWQSRASGAASHAEGWNNIASGVGAHAEGGNFEEGGNTASGFGSHAEGQGTYAVGAASHSEGSHTTAHEQYSHAEGNHSYTLGQSSHAEGSNTYTYNNAEHSEGIYNLSHKESTTFGNAYNTIHTTGIGTSNTNRKNALAIMQNGDMYVINIGDYNGTNPKTSYSLQEFIEKIGVWERGAGELSVQTRGTNCRANAPYSVSEGILTLINSEALYSHAEGEYTYTVGRASHAEGHLSYAYGFGSHAEGIGTYASAEGAHTEGTYTIASGISSHTEGTYTYSIGNYSHAEGEHLIAFGRGSHAEGESLYTYSQIANDIGEITPANILNYWSSGQGDNAFSFAYGEASHVEGLDNITIGRFSHAEGWMSLAYGEVSHVEGFVTASYGKISHAEGFGTAAYGAYSHAEGECTVTYGRASHAEGQCSYTIGSYTHAEGSYTYAYGNSSHSEGYLTYSLGYYTHAEGQNTYATSLASHAEGSFTYAEGESSHSEGTYTKASGNNSHVEGQLTYTDANNAHAEGYLSYATASCSHAEGNQTTASGLQSHAEGQDTEASGKQAHAEGQNTIASADNTHAEGLGTTASNIRAHAEGLNTIASGENSHAEGQGASGKGATAKNSHSEGNGTLSSGAAAHAEGTTTTASGAGAHAEGQNTIASATNAHAEGNGSQATGAGAHAEGTNTIASGKRAHAEGRQTHAEGDDSHAEGFRSYTTAVNSHVEGSNTYAYNFAEHAEGNFNISHTGEGSATTWYGSPSYTVSSVGIGNQYYDQELQQQVTIRKNAIEIMQNGDFYLYGIGDYDGTNPDNATTLQTYLTTAGVWERGDGTLAVQTKETSSYAVGDYTVAAGYFTYAYNQAESAFGQYNKSNYYELEEFGYCYNTIHSIGVGYIFHDTENDEDIEVRKNALEITQNGEIYLLGIGDYDGTNTELAYSLKEVIIEDELIISYAFNDLDQRIDILQYQIDDIPAPVFERGQGIMSIQQTDSGSTATGTYSFVMGQTSSVSGNYSNILGTNCTTSSNYSTTLGYNNTNTGNYTFVSGNNNASAAESSIVLGSSNGVNNYINNILIGNSNQSDGSNVFSIGRNNIFESSNAASIGISNTISDQYAFILGYNNESSSNYSGVLGISNTLSGLYTFTVGYGNTISANYGLAIGSNNAISGIRGLGIGNNIKVLSDNEIGIGKYNYSNGSVLEIGVGTADNARQNALEVNSTGELYLLGVGNYTGTSTSNAKSLQLYLEENERTISEAFNDLNDRILNLTDAISQLVSSPFNYGAGEKSIQSIGTNCSAGGNYSFAEGYGTIATNQYEVALGTFNKSNNGNSLDTKTALSLGIGTGESNKIDALEIMQNGDMYIYGIGNYNGTNPTDNTVLSLQETITDIYNKVGNAQALQNFTLSATVDVDGNDVISITIGSVTRSVTLTNSWGMIPPPTN